MGGGTRGTAVVSVLWGWGGLAHKDIVGIAFGGLGGRIRGILHQSREEGGFVLEEEGGAWLAAFAILARVEVRDPREVFLDMVGKRAMEKREEKEKKRKKNDT